MVVDTVGVPQNYAASTTNKYFNVPHSIIRDQPRERGREKFMDENVKKREIIIVT
jgi:hypothetical protein